MTKIIAEAGFTKDGVGVSGISPSPEFTIVELAPMSDGTIEEKIIKQTAGTEYQTPGLEGVWGLVFEQGINKNYMYTVDAGVADVDRAVLRCDVQILQPKGISGGGIGLDYGKGVNSDTFSSFGKKVLKELEELKKNQKKLDKRQQDILNKEIDFPDFPAFPEYPEFPEFPEIPDNIKDIKGIQKQVDSLEKAREDMMSFLKGKFSKGLDLKDVNLRIDMEEVEKSISKAINESAIEIFKAFASEKGRSSKLIKNMGDKITDLVGKGIEEKIKEMPQLLLKKSK